MKNYGIFYGQENTLKKGPLKYDILFIFVNFTFNRYRKRS